LTGEQHVRGLLVTDIRVLAEDTGELLRALTVDPSQDYQRQPRR
jgi:hypothetical protein